MKTCPFCAEEIQDAAIVCKHCGRDLTPPPVQRAPPPLSVQLVEPKKKTGCVAWGVAIIFGLMFVGWCSNQMTPQPQPTSSTPVASGPSTPSAAPVASAKQLALLSSRGYESEGGGYLIVEGQVQNISGNSLKNVQAVATWYDKDGNFIKSDDALIDYNPVLPGQTSPFKTMSSSNPAMAKYTVEFKEFFGGGIPTEDRRKK